MKNNSITMTEKELQDFIKDNPSESETLEYKLKPNFNEIKSTMEHLLKRMHFKILQTIYAFANTNGGQLYIGIDDKKEIIGLDKVDETMILGPDKKAFKGMISKINKAISFKPNEIPLEKKDRKVIIITVEPLKLYDKPQLLDGVFYFRKNDSTMTADKTDSWKRIYENHQLYFYALEAIKNNLNKIIDRKSDFKDTSVADHFIEGLKVYIDDFAKKYYITTEKEIINKSKSLLEKIQGLLHKKINKSQPHENSIKSLSSSTEKEKQLIDDFINTYKQIIELGV